jgi:hypothetical protein
MTLSDHQLGVLLASTLMNADYPHSFAPPYVPDSDGRQVLDRALERLCRARQENHEQQLLGPRQHELSSREASILAEVLEACLAECNGNQSKVHVLLEANDEVEVRMLVDLLHAAGIGWDVISS